ncbi:MAG: UDP-glucose 4-epimerase GalE [Lentisphaerae bacterium]|nr:UDP-glucose 4-epimerase GalE [Lentisphaerota bacterium]
MKILVTGGSGYIGSVTSELLLDEGHAVVVFDNLERGHRAAVDRRAALVEGDLRDAAAIRAAVRDARPDAVMHFAAYALVPESMRRPDLYFENNVGGGMNLIAAMLAAGVRRIVFSSTCAVYGEPAADCIAEDTPTRPANPYGESKLMLEKMLEWHARRGGMQAVFLRYFNAAGATEKFGEDHDPETHLIPNVLQAALGRRDKVVIYGDDFDTPDGTCVRDYIHIHDLARAHIRALDAGCCGAFNLGNGRGYSVKEVLETARAVTGRPIPCEIGARRPGDPPRLVAASGKARAELRWTPRFPELSAIVASAWNWHRAHPEGYAR